MLIASGASLAGAEKSAGAPWVLPAVNAPRVQRCTFDSASAKTKVSFFIYTPEQYDTDKDRRFPVLYWLHGTGGGLGGVRPLAAHFDAAIRAGKTPPILVVFANGLTTSMWCDSKDGSVPMETVVVRELVPHVDATFRTLASREGRLIEGFSMGGYGAARLGFKHPDVFGAISILAGGPLDLEFKGPRAMANPQERERILQTVYGGDMEYYRAQSPWVLAEQSAAAVRGKTRVRQAVGNRDSTAGLNRSFSEHLRKLDIPHTFTVLPGVDHNAIRLFDALGESSWEFYRAAFAHARAAEPQRGPNVLFILVDDMGWGDLGANGGVDVPTPRMGGLAREGMRLTQFYTASPICSPSRCGFITGRFPARCRITSYLQTRAGNRECEQADFLDPKAPSFVRAFKAAGYATAHIGKWHLGGGRDVTDAPKFSAYGYDIGLGTYESPEPAAALGLKTTPWGTELEPQQVARHDRTRWMVDQALAFAKQHAAQPWLVNLWFDDVHTPHRPSAGQRAKAAEGKGSVEFRAVLQETDREIGRLLDGLRDLKLDSNTLVIVCGDNGPEPSFNRARSGGLRGMKWSLYEGGLRTPLVVRLPGVVPAGVVNASTVVSAVDFFPTLCSLANVPAPDGAGFDGEDLSAIFRGGKQSRSKPLFWEYGRKPAPKGQKGLRAFPYPNEPDSKSPNVALRDGRWKLLVNADGSGAELYDLATDPNETKTLTNAQPDIARQLTEQALAWRKSLP